MIVAFISFILSFVGIVLMLVLQLHKMNTGKTFVIFRFGAKLDQYLRHKYAALRTNLSFLNKKTMKLLFHYVLDKIEEKFIKMKDAGHTKAKDLIEKAKAKETKMKTGKKASEFMSKIKNSKQEKSGTEIEN